MAGRKKQSLVGLQDGALPNAAALRPAVPLLLDWYDRHARELPWRDDPLPYRVWISEIMLQQTRVEAVKPYFERFLQELPDVARLAAVPEDRLLKLWEGLGYYNRARNLQKAARVMLAEHGGQLPRTREALLALPGIGDYTSGAISSIAYGLPEPAVDGNVLRVFARVREDRRDIARPEVKRELTALLRELYPAGRAGDFTQCLMELGALVCVPNGAPHCGECPLRALCRAAGNGTTQEIPVKAKAAARRVEERTVFLLWQGGRLAVEKRPARGLLAGMWQLPNVAGALTPGAARDCAAEWQTSPGRVRAAGEAKHIFSHLEWRMRGYAVTCAQASARFCWVTPATLREELSLPAAFAAFWRLAEADAPAE